LKEFYRKLDKYTAVTRHFVLNEFNFEERNAKQLWNSLDIVDQEMFPFNMATLDWNSYIESYVQGCRRFLLKEDPETIAKSRKKIRM
jgi:fatty acyl-CoA reductase